MFVLSISHRLVCVSAVMGVVAGTSLSGCDLSLPPLRIEDESCGIYSSVSVDLPRELAAAHCEFVRSLGETLGVELAGVQIDYALYGGSEEVGRNCGNPPIASPAACYYRSVVFAATPFHRHELVHAALHAGGLDGSSALQEGAAELFSCAPSGLVLDGDLPLAHLANSSAFYGATDLTYAGATAFVSFLLDRGGEATFAELMDATDRCTSLGGLDSATRRLYGESIEDLHAAWRAEPPQPGYRVCRPVYECSSPELDDSGSLTLVRGVSYANTTAGAVRTFTVETPGELHVEARAPGASVVVISCDRGPPVMRVYQDTRELDERAPIGPGRYALWLTARVLEGSDSEVEAELRVTVE